MSKRKSPFEPPYKPEEYLQLLGEYAQKRVDELCVPAEIDGTKWDPRFISTEIGGRFRRFQLKPKTLKKQVLRVEAIRAIALLESLYLAQREYEAATKEIGEEWANRLFDVAHNLGLRDALSGLNGVDYQGFLQKMGAIKGGKAVSAILNADHKELHPKYQPAVEKYMAKGDSYNAASEKVAKDFGVKDGRTVRNNTVNPSPRNRGRQR